MKRGDILRRYAIIPQSNESLAAVDATQLAQYYGEAWQISHRSLLIQMWWKNRTWLKFLLRTAGLFRIKFNTWTDWRGIIKVLV
jgi:hypothetical protein